eukprot:93654-Amphidinium_carterae.1
MKQYNTETHRASWWRESCMSKCIMKGTSTESARRCKACNMNRDVKIMDIWDQFWVHVCARRVDGLNRKCNGIMRESLHAWQVDMHMTRARKAGCMHSKHGPLRCRCSPVKHAR